MGSRRSGPSRVLREFLSLAAPLDTTVPASRDPIISHTSWPSKIDWCPLRLFTCLTTCAPAILLVLKHCSEYSRLNGAESSSVFSGKQVKKPSGPWRSSGCSSLEDPQAIRKRRVFAQQCGPQCCLSRLSCLVSASMPGRRRTLQHLEHATGLLDRVQASR